MIKLGHLNLNPKSQSQEFKGDIDFLTSAAYRKLLEVFLLEFG